MKILNILIAILLNNVLLFGQENQSFIDKDFKWRMIIPNNFKIIKTEDWIYTKNKENLSKGYKLETEINCKIISIIKNDSLNYLISYSATELNNNASLNMQKEMFEIFQKNKNVKSNILDEKIKIGSYNCNCSKIEYTLEDQTKISTEYYACMIKNKLLAVFIRCNDAEKGQLIKDAWVNSTFK
jgi:hypothetical protein